MAKLHEILAAEKTVMATTANLITETANKFSKEHFFAGHTKTLKMINESPENQAIELAARDVKALPTTVYETLYYTLDYWARSEDLQACKNATNTKALADLEFRGKTLLTGLPVDELMGLEARLELLRNNVLLRMPTLDASKVWRQEPTDPPHVWTAGPDHTAKTEKQTYAVVMSPATDKHPAQVKEASKDAVVGTFSTVFKSGSATTLQKAEVLAVIDELIVEVKRARQRANSVDVVPVRVGQAIANVLLDALRGVA